MCVPVLLNYWITCENIVAIQPIGSLKQFKKNINRLNNIGRKIILFFTERAKWGTKRGRKERCRKIEKKQLKTLILIEIKNRARNVVDDYSAIAFLNS